MPAVGSDWRVSSLVVPAWRRAENPEFRKRFEDRATVVKLGEGARGNADVKVIGKAAIDSGLRDPAGAARRICCPAGTARTAQGRANRRGNADLAAEHRS